MAWNVHIYDMIKTISPKMQELTIFKTSSLEIWNCFDIYLHICTWCYRNLICYGTYTDTYFAAENFVGGSQHYESLIAKHIVETMSRHASNQRITLK